MKEKDKYEDYILYSNQFPAEYHFLRSHFLLRSTARGLHAKCESEWAHLISLLHVSSQMTFILSWDSVRIPKIIQSRNEWNLLLTFSLEMATAGKAIIPNPTSSVLRNYNYFIFLCHHLTRSKAIKIKEQTMKSVKEKTTFILLSLSCLYAHFH